MPEVSTKNVDGERLWQSLMDMAVIGATEKGGVARLALTDLDRQGRDLFVSWCEAAGCSIRVDQMGNIFAHRGGLEDDLPPIVMGSHLDSQPTGGKFDGVYGVLAGLEVIRSLNDHDVETRSPVEVAVWTNEEGARFAPAMIGSGVFAGAFDLEYGLSRESTEGVTLGEELERIGFAGDEPIGAGKPGAHLEVHIEQGPILEAEGLQIGIVTGVQGIRWYDATVEGEETHAGPNPMDMRKDPVKESLPLLQKIYQIAQSHAPDARVTIGQLEAYPGSRNTVPGSTRFTVDIRHPEAHILDEMDQELRGIVADYPRDKVSVSIEEIWHSPPVPFDPACLQAIRQGVLTFGYPAKEMVSGAGHDSVYLSRVAPTAMIFIPCEKGISHNESENATPSDVTAGANVLFQTVLQLAEGSES